MNLRELNIFLAVCECGNMSNAAKKLYMTQPAISQAILELESEYNIKLFDRIGKKLLLTYAGEILKNYSKKILAMTKEAENTMNSISNLENGRIIIGASQTAGTYLLPSLIGKFFKFNKNIKLPFIIDNTRQIVQHILDNDIDIGIIEGPVHTDDIVINHFLDDELYLICSKEHKWAKRPLVNLHEIENENMIVRESGSGTREIFENVMKLKKIKYKIYVELDNIEAIKKAVEHNIGISVISKLAIMEELKSGKLIKVPLDGINFSRSFNIIYHKNKFLSDLLTKFINFLYSNINLEA